MFPALRFRRAILQAITRSVYQLLCIGVAGQIDSIHLLHALHIGNNDPGTLGYEFIANSPTDAAGTTGTHHNFSFQC